MSSWMVHAGCVYVADIRPSWAWTSRSVETMQRNACMHRIGLDLYSDPKELEEIWVSTFNNKCTRKNSQPDSSEAGRTCNAVSCMILFKTKSAVLSPHRVWWPRTATPSSPTLSAPRLTPAWRTGCSNVSKTRTWPATTLILPPAVPSPKTKSRV